MRRGRVSEVKQELIGVPAPFGFEGPASWLSRAALSQGINIREMQKLFGLMQNTDADLSLSQQKADLIAMMCGFPAETFKFAVRMFSSVRLIDNSGQKFLLSTGHSGGLYRYCPGCLHDQRVKHFPLHWRFKNWRYCPVHECMMEDRCLHCGMPVKLPDSMFFCGPDKNGVAFLDRCLSCEKKLSEHWQDVQGLTGQKLLDGYEKQQLEVGRAILSAFYNGYYAFAFNPDQKLRLSGLRVVHHLGGSDHFWLGIDNRELLRRKSSFFKASGDYPQ